MPKLAIVAPAFNEAECLPELHRRLAAALTGDLADFQLVLVDDGSRDATWTTIENLARRDSRVCGLRFSRNFGHHVAITAGLDHVDADWIVTMDADLQDAPEAIPLLYAEAQKGFDVVVALRRRRRHGVLKTLLARSFWRVFRRMSGIDFQPGEGIFRMMSRRVVGNLRRLSEQARFYPALVRWVGFRQTAIETEHGERFAGTTKYPLRRQLRLAATAALSFSEKPLQYMVAFGALVCAGALAYGTTMIVRALFGSVSVEGWASLIVAIFFMGGVVVASLGVVGLYVGQIFAQVKNRPLYVLAETAGANAIAESLGARLAAESAEA